MLGQIIAIDIGGTNIRAGTLEDRDEPRYLTSTPTARSDIQSTLATAVSAVVADLKTPLAGIIVGCPGLIDRTGKVTAALYLDTVGLHVTRVLTSKFKVPVRTINDANLQALALTDRITHGAYIVFGTGVGGAIISGSAVIDGTNGYAGEIGHMPVSGASNICLCGRTGCLDTVASGFWLERLLGPRWWDLGTLPAAANSALADAGR